jgi:hypothetical protein
MKIKLKIIKEHIAQFDYSIVSLPLRHDNHFSFNYNYLFRVGDTGNLLSHFSKYFTNYKRIKRQGGTWLRLN